MSGVKSPGATTIFRKTKLCKFHLMGRCLRMEACCFAHSKDELQPLPMLYCTKPCAAWSQTGRCAMGDACTYAHGVDELRKVAGPQLNVQAQGWDQSGNGLHSSASAQRSAFKARSADVRSLLPAATAEFSAQDERDAQVAAQITTTLQMLTKVTEVATHHIRQLQQTLKAPPTDVSLQSSESGSPQAQPHGGDEMRSACYRSFQGKEKDPFPEDLCNAGLGSPGDSWSRQSTEEGPEPFGGFSRQSSEDSTESDPQLLETGFSRQGAEEGVEVGMDGANCQRTVHETVGKAQATGKHRECTTAGTFLGAERGRAPVWQRDTHLEYAVKNSFLHFSVRGSVGAYRRVHSAGDGPCLL